MDKEERRYRAESVAPIYVRIGYGSSETVKGPDEALHYLMQRWPLDRGTKYDLAGIAVSNAVERRASAEAAKEAFIAAAIEAQVLA
ncbi:DUF982 domain-containing protein [Rhizobium panacihumi]|uniref:DUF982 domain-containing protein n=1 Tax=Rhizobium panacihumi TaxID=2008450 RepID=UPI003D79D9AC